MPGYITRGCYRLYVKQVSKEVANIASNTWTNAHTSVLIHETRACWQNCALFSVAKMSLCPILHKFFDTQK